MLSRFLNSKASTPTFGALLLACSSLASAALGLGRDRLLASRFGAGEELDAYFAAFRIPDFIYGIFIAGAFSAAFLPLFVSYVQKNRDNAWKFTSNVINLWILFLGVSALILFFAMPLLIPLLAPGFDESNQKLTLNLARLLLVSPILFGISAVFSSLLQYFQKMAAFALAPLVYNLSIIGGILFLSPQFGIQGVVFGVLAGAAGHALLQYIAVQKEFRWIPLLNFKGEGIAKLLALGIPRLLGAGAAFATPIVMVAFASLVSVGSVAILQLANNIQLIPVGVIGVSFSLSVFPFLSRVFSEKDDEQFRNAFSSTFRHIMFFAIPASVMFFLLRSQLVRLILGTGKFGWDETRLTAAVLGVFALGILFQSLIPFLMRTYFSLHLTKIPSLIGIAGLGTTAALIFLLRSFLSSGFLGMSIFSFFDIHDLQEAVIVALPLAVVLSSMVQCALLLIFLAGRIKGISYGGISSSFLKIIASSFLMGAGTYGVLRIFGSFSDLRTFGEVFWQTVLAGIAGLAIFLFVFSLLKGRELKEITGSLKQQFVYE